MTTLHISILITMIVISVVYLVGCFILGMWVGKIGAKRHWTFLQVLAALIISAFMWSGIYQFIIWLLRLALS